MNANTVYLWVKFAKLLSVLVLVSGTIGASIAQPLELRQVFAYRLAGPGFGLTWTFGFILAYFTGQALLSLFVISALVLSFLSLHGTLYLAGREERRTRGAIAMALVPLLVTIWVMVLRPF